MNSEQNPLQDFLLDLQSAGLSLDQGSFTVQPERAVEILRQQGQLGQNAPLHLLSAIYQHTSGSAIERREHRGFWRLSWPSAHGRLSDSVALLLAHESLAANGVRLFLESSSVRLVPDKPDQTLRFLFESVAPRLAYYPWQDSHATAAALHEDRQGSSLIRYVSVGRQARFVPVIHGISYPLRWALPVEALCWDERLHPDLTLSQITDQDSVQALQRRAQQVLRDLLWRSLEEAQPFLLSAHSSSTVPLPLWVESLPYAVQQSEDPQLAAAISERVLFADATGCWWTVRQLLDIERSGTSLLAVPAPSAPGR